MDELHQQLNVLRVRLDSLTKEYFGPNFCNEVQEYVLSHPFIALALVGSILLSIIPFVIFLIFAFITGGIGAIVFICIEGCIIAFAGLILIGVVSFITFITVGFTSCLAVIYWFSVKLHRMINSYQLVKSRENDLSANSSSRKASQCKKSIHSQGINGNITPDSTNDGERVSDLSENYELVG